MTDELLPWTPDKPPPNKLSEEYLQEEIKSARNGIGLLLIVGFTMGRHIQVMSRRPGTSGILLVAAWPLGACISCFYLAAATGDRDSAEATPFLGFMVVQGAFWLVSFVKALATSIDRQPHFRALGEGFLARHIPGLDQRMAGIASDFLVGVLMVVGLYTIESPVVGNCYLGIFGLLMLCHGCVYFRDLQWRGRIRSAQKRATNWHEDVRGRHHL